MNINFSVIAVFDKIPFELKNKTALKMSKILVIKAINLLFYYMIMKVSYLNHLIIIKLIVLNIKFEIFKETDFGNDSTTKPQRSIKSGQCVLRSSEN